MDSKVSPFIQTAEIEQNAEGHLAVVAKTIALARHLGKGLAA